MKALIAIRGNDHWIEEELHYMYAHRLSLFLKFLITIIGIAALVAVLPL